jgi:hopanoid biosynthesis associated protein HpnK
VAAEALSVRRRLIVSADDFGMSAGVNAGIERAHREGILKQASLMVSGEGAVEAVGIALRTPSLAVGLHLVLVQGRAALPHHALPDLTDSAGMLPDAPVASGVRYFFSPRLREQVRREVLAQLDAFNATGLPLSHVDGHLTIHVHPVVLELLCEVRQRYGIRFVRLPLEPLAPSLAFDRRSLPRKLGEALIFGVVARWARRKLRRAGIGFADRMFGMHQTGHVSEDYLLHLLPRLGPGITELYCHPGVTDAEIRRWTPAYERDAELVALTSPRVREAAAREGIELLSYRDL